jgi:cell pole-organizing protein PopZ
MSDAKGQQHEPSMEEILASIRRIIAEDGDTAAEPAGAAAIPAEAAPAPAAPTPAAPAPADDILELTDVVEPDGSVVSLNAAPAKAEPPPPPPPPVREVEPAPGPASGEGIVSPATAAASVAAFSQITSLSSRSELRDRNLGIGAGHLTLESLVRAELRPILKDWLDQYLPDMVERLVQEEITRLVRDVQRR